MSKEELMDHITGKLPELDYLKLEMVCGLIDGLTGQEERK